MKKTALILTTRHLYPPNGGDKLRILSTINYLKKDHIIDLAVIGFEKTNVKNYQVNFKGIRKIRFYKPKLINFTFNLFKFFNIPFQSLLYFDERILKIIKKDFDFKYDLLHVHLLRLSLYSKKINAKKKIIDLTDSLVLSYSRAKRYKKLNLLMRFIYLLELKRIYSFKKKNLSLFNFISFVSNYDKKFFEKIFPNLKKKTQLIENSKNINKIKSNLFSIKSNNLLYIGNFKSFSNLISVKYVSNLVNNFNQHQKKKVKLILVGNFDYKLKLYLFLNNKIKHQDWKNLKKNKYLASICATKIGSGFQNKILDYLNLQIPVLTNNYSYYGLSKELKKKVKKFNNQKDFNLKLNSIRK